LPLKIAVVGKYTAGTLSRVRESLPEDFEVFAIDNKKKFENLTDAECIILRGFSMAVEDFRRISNLRLVQRWGVGYDNVDIVTAGNKGIFVCNLPGVNSYAVAEMVITYILALYKNLINHHNSASKGIWTRDLYNERTYTLKNKTVGLIGFGNVARHVCKRVQCFDAIVQYYDIVRLNSTEEKRLHVKYMTLEDLLRTSDVISIHVPLTKETQNLINKDNLAFMKKTSIIINTSRGGIVNEKDLYEALVNNKILGAGLDCFNSEPIDENNPLLKLNNIVLTPHIGGASADLSDEMIPLVVDNLLRLRNNERLKYVVNAEYL
jgi:D-3-phosphoglycerate dehydrogenase